MYIEACNSGLINSVDKSEVNEEEETLTVWEDATPVTSGSRSGWVGDPDGHSLAEPSQPVLVFSDSPGAWERDPVAFFLGRTHPSRLPAPWPHSQLVFPLPGKQLVMAY